MFQNIPVFAPLLLMLGALIGAGLAYMASTRASNVARRNADLQAHTAQQLKIAEFRQAWIHTLRDAMAEFQSYGVTPGLDQAKERKFYEVGTKIELLMNPTDQDYVKLQNCLYGYLSVQTESDKFSANPIFVSTCQAILRREWAVTKDEIEKAFPRARRA